MGFTDGVGKAYISQLVEPEKSGTAFGLYYTAVGLCALFASIIAGFLWKYVDDLIGKGLEFSVLIQLFFYASLSTIPLALPLSILLSSIMTFGNLGEHYELVAIKSYGLSLQKIMRPLISLNVLSIVSPSSRSLAQ